MHWTILSRWITQCPKENKPLPWPIFPRLYVDNQPDAIAAGASAGGPNIAHNLTSLTYPGRVVELSVSGRDCLSFSQHRTALITLFVLIVGSTWRDSRTLPPADSDKHERGATLCSMVRQPQRDLHAPLRA